MPMWPCSKNPWRLIGIETSLASEPVANPPFGHAAHAVALIQRNFLGMASCGLRGPFAGFHRRFRRLDGVERHDGDGHRRENGDNQRLTRPEGQLEHEAHLTNWTGGTIRGGVQAGQTAVPLSLATQKSFDTQFQASNHARATNLVQRGNKSG